ncbi:YdcF family protein [Paraflavitalea speifideaquila]|uniref:YdcF family protein n=1 Tax=Paraflavitalea speifideaquila TaxID=3076558 RepID=UPI0028ED530A|nr:YdcF family protein [Paraflavitalea speifideiaquila]
MVKVLLTTAMVLMACHLFAQQAGPDPRYKLVTGKNVVRSKNYYLLTLLLEDKGARKLIESDTALSNMAQRKLADLSNALKTCNNNAGCYTEALKLSDQEIQLAGERLTALYEDNNALGKLVKLHLVPSGTYILFHNESPAVLLRKAWEQDAMGINFAIGVYAEGKKANYPLIDSISFNVNHPRYGSMLYSPAYVVGQECANTHLFFHLSLTASLQFIELNERDQAADYEPMESTVNKAAYQRIKTLPWNTFKYSLILVPGAGPDDPAVPLSAGGMLRCRLAAIQYFKGLAPFIMVSGGKVHPYKTKYNEAEEMKRFLINKLQVPENAIIMEPHARHTTTNMRNAVRLMYRYGFPMNKPALTATERGQSAWITGSLVERCKRELDAVPYKPGERLSETEAVFYPLLEALHIDPTEPMDP